MFLNKPFFKYLQLKRCYYDRSSSFHHIIITYLFRLLLFTPLMIIYLYERLIFSPSYILHIYNVYIPLFVRQKIKRITKHIKDSFRANHFFRKDIAFYHFLVFFFILIVFAVYLVVCLDYYRRVFYITVLSIICVFF